MYKKTIIIIVIILTAIVYTNAQSIKIYFNNGDINTYQLSEVSKISFSDNNMLLHKTDASIITMAISDIKKYDYDMASAIHEYTNSSSLDVHIYPVPSKGNINIDYTLQKMSEINISLMSLDGKLVETILNTEQNKGEYIIKWENTNLNPGIYLVRIKTEYITTIKKLIIL